MYIFTIYPLPYEVSVVGGIFWLGLLHHKNLDMQSRIESMFRFFVFFFLVAGRLQMLAVKWKAFACSSDISIVWFIREYLYRAETDYVLHTSQMVFSS